MSNGFSALLGYTLSKSEDNGSGIRTLNGDQLFPQNSNCVADELSSGCEWGNSVFDVRHRFGSSIIYELPFGAGKQYIQEGVGGAILGWLAVDQHLEPVERLREKPEHWTGSREPWPRRSATYGRKWPGCQ